MRLLTVVTLTLLVAFAMACAPAATNTPAPTPEPQITPPPEILSHVLEVRANPEQAAEFLFNPLPIGQGLFVHGRTVTIDVLPREGWQIDRWVGPVFEVVRESAKIKMDSSQSVVVRLVQASARIATTAPTILPTAILLPTYTPLPTGTPRPTYTPLPPLPTYTPLPTATPRPTATPTPVPTATPKPSPTPTPTPVPPTPTPRPTATPVPTATPLPTVTPTVAPTPPGYTVTATASPSLCATVHGSGTYAEGTEVTTYYTNLAPGCKVTGMYIKYPNIEDVRRCSTEACVYVLNADLWITYRFNYNPPTTPTLVPTPTPTPMPTPSPTPTLTPVPNDFAGPVVTSVAVAPTEGSLQTTFGFTVGATDPTGVRLSQFLYQEAGLRDDLPTAGALSPIGCLFQGSPTVGTCSTEVWAGSYGFSPNNRYGTYRFLRLMIWDNYDNLTIYNADGTVGYPPRSTHSLIIPDLILSPSR